MSLAPSPDSPIDDQERPSVSTSLKDTLDASSINGDLAAAKDILQRWSSQDTPFTPGDLKDALQYAVSYRHPLLVQLMLEHGAPISVTAVSSATTDEPGSLPIFELFVQHGWRVDGITNPVSKMLAMK